MIGCCGVQGQGWEAKDEDDQASSIGAIMTPADMINLWKRMKSIFPSTLLDVEDDPEKFFSAKVGQQNHITLNQTKEYETRLKASLSALS